MPKPYFDVVLRSTLLPLHERSGIAHCFLFVVTVKLDFKKIVGGEAIRTLLSFVNADVDRIAWLVLIHVVMTEVACCLGMLKAN